MLDDTFKINYKTLPIAISTESPLYTNPHNHAEFELLLFQSGTAEVSVGNKSYNVKKGDIIFINPFEVHSILFKESNTEFSRLCICFDCNILINKKTADKISNEEIFINHFLPGGTFDAEYITTEFLSVIKAYTEDTELSDTEIIAHLSLMFSHLIKISHFNTIKNHSDNSELCSKILGYIKQEYMSDITSKDAAETLSYNHSYFCRIFKKIFKKTFSEYLNMYRVANSKSMFEDNSLSVSEIAAKSGFNSYNYFSKCFKRYFGILPSEYMKHRNTKKT